MEREREAYIRPRDNIIGGLLERTNNGVFKDLIWKIKAVCVLDKGEARLATTGVTTESNVGIEVWNILRVGF
jgi:hypothetical protein